MIAQETLTLSTRGRATHDLTGAVERVVAGAGVRRGLCHVFVRHTSASLLLCENADPQVRADLEAFMRRLAPDGDPLYGHDSEGPDDMPAHVRSVLTGADLTVPIVAGRCALGTWQGIYLWEHRTAPQRRAVVVTVCGE